MVENKNLKASLSHVTCTKCGSSLASADFISVEKLPFALLANAICDKCKFENVLTISSLGSGTISMISDLTSSEVKKFVKTDKITAKDILAVHKSLKKDSLCNLLHNIENN